MKYSTNQNNNNIKKKQHSSLTVLSTPLCIYCLPPNSNNIFKFLPIAQCHVAAMVAASASVSYSSVNQYDGNRTIMWRHLNSCSSCDSNSGSSFRRQNSMRGCRHHHHHNNHSHPHYHHTRKPAIRANKRCTFATTTTTISPSGTISGIGGGITTATINTHHAIVNGNNCGTSVDNNRLHSSSSTSISSQQQTDFDSECISTKPKTKFSQ